MFEIKNKDELREKLINILVDFELDNNHYQTDVYAYVDIEGTVDLELFSNPGGNSWLADDHITIYSDKQRSGYLSDFFDSVDFLVTILGNDLLIDARDAGYIDDDFETHDLDDYYSDICTYISCHMNLYRNKLRNAILDFCFFEEEVDYIIDKLVYLLNYEEDKED